MKTLLRSLVRLKLADDDAFRRVQQHALNAWDSQTQFRQLLESDEAITNTLNTAALDALFDPDAFLTHIDASFARLGL